MSAQYPFFQTATQPDVIRAVQKDELYLQQGTAAAYEVLREILGPATALRYAREAKVLAHLLYYALTTGWGHTTLGEEYCDMLQVTGGAEFPGLSRRSALVLLQTVVPYIGERVASRLERRTAALATWGDDDPQSSFVPHQSSQASWASPSLRPSQGGQGQQGQEGQEEDARGHSGVGGRNGGVVGAVGGGVKQARELVRRRVLELTGMVAQHWPQIRQGVEVAGKVNLALFYLYEAYYQWSHRLTGTRYHSTRAPGYRHPSYRLLGVLLLAQLTTTALSNLRPLLPGSETHQPTHMHAVVLPDAPSPPPKHSTHTGTGSSQPAHPKQPAQQAVPAVAGRSPRHTIADSSHLDRRQPSGISPDNTMQPEHPAGITGPSGQNVWAGNAASSYSWEGVQPVVVTAGRQCPLCLSPRNCPTSTPCGHVFCWECVTQWCGEKPECPLCRAPVLPQQLLCIYHADF